MRGLNAAVHGRQVVSLNLLQYSLQPVEEVLGTCGMESIHMTLDNLEVDELLLAQKQRVADDDGPNIVEGNHG